MPITPFTPNQTCDVYHSTNSPPAAPDVAGVAFFLEERWENIKPTYLDQSGSGINHTHVAHLALGVDVRDGDSIYVPDKNGTPFVVQFVARRGKGTGLDHKVAYVFRADGSKVPWPTDHL